MSSFKQDFSWSVMQFEGLVQPVLENEMGGQFIHVECLKKSPLANLLDRSWGIDVLRFTNESMEGMASRIQVVNRPYNTFTIRKERDNGSETEYSKRLKAIENNDPYPEYAIQAYVTSKSNGSLLSLAVARTVDIIEYIKQGFAGENRTTNAVFYTVPFDDIVPILKVGW